MRLVFLSFLLVVSSLSLTAQQLPEWYRVYTFEESLIEMNTSLVTSISKDVARVRFRWTFKQPEVWSVEPKLKYKSRLEVMEFNCSSQQYRPYHFTFFDPQGDIIQTLHSPDEWRDWRTVTSGSMMGKLLAPACELIKKKTRPEVVSDDKVQSEKAAKYALGSLPAQSQSLCSELSGSARWHKTIRG